MKCTLQIDPERPSLLFSHRVGRHTRSPQNSSLLIPSGTAVTGAKEPLHAALGSASPCSARMVDALVGPCNSEAKVVIVLQPRYTQNRVF